MVGKPLIIYIENDFGTESYNNFRDALIAVLEKDCDCAIANFPYTQRMKDDEAKVKQAIRYGSVILFIVAQDEYDESEHEQAIAYFRFLAPNAPIVVIPNGRENTYTANLADRTIKAMRHTDPELISYVKYLRSEWMRNASWLRPGSSIERQLIADQLVSTHRTNNPGDSSFGESDDNERTVAEALRVRLLGSELTGIEFDNTLDRTKADFPIIENEIYRAELERFRHLSAPELAVIDAFLQVSVGAGGGHGICVPSVCGFAIDPVTQEINITHGSGNHRVAAQILSQRLEVMGILRRESLADEVRYSWRLVQGRIVSNAPGFSTPFLMLYQQHTDDEVFKNTGIFLQSKRQFIPVSSYAKLLE